MPYTYVADKTFNSSRVKISGDSTLKPIVANNLKSQNNSYFQKRILHFLSLFFQLNEGDFNLSMMCIYFQQIFMENQRS